MLKKYMLFGGPGQILARVTWRVFSKKENALILEHYTNPFKTRLQRKGKLQRNLKLMFIFLEAIRDLLPLPKPLPNRRRAPEPISTRWRPHRRAYF
jgi:hypothetical protein